LKQIPRTTVDNLATGLSQKNLRLVAAHLVVMDAFFKDGVFQDEVFNKQLSEEIKASPKHTSDATSKKDGR
jgi:uncharacterized protein YdaU (DUF1376 family)